MRPRTFVAVFLSVWLGLTVLGRPAAPHETAEGIPFPPECCSNRDCEPLEPEKKTELPNGDWLVQVRCGIVRIPASFPRRDFYGPRMYVCASCPPLGGTPYLYCLLVPPAV